MELDRFALFHKAFSGALRNLAAGHAQTSVMLDGTATDETWVIYQDHMGWARAYGTRCVLMQQFAAARINPILVDMGVPTDLSVRLVAMNEVAVSLRDKLETWLSTMTDRLTFADVDRRPLHEFSGDLTAFAAGKPAAVQDLVVALLSPVSVPQAMLAPLVVGEAPAATDYSDLPAAIVADVGLLRSAIEDLNIVEAA